MYKGTPKYFHYFLACVTFDILLIFLVFFWHLNITTILLFIGFWLIANFINYPRIAARRYISYYQLLGLSFRQLLTFYFFVLILFVLEEPSIAIPPLTETWPLLIILPGRLIFVFILRFYRILGRGYNRFISIGKTPLMNRLETEFLEKKSHGYRREARFDRFDLTQIRALILTHQVNEIYCSSQCVNQNDLSELLTLTYEYGVNVHVISDNSNSNTPVDIDSVPFEFSISSIENYPLTDKKNLIVKRIFDLIFSILVLTLVLSWMIPILGLIIKIDSSGPIFFKQPRAGRNGKYFTCLKFRSMKKDADSTQAVPYDSRITRVGKIIRKLSLDEFPQFLNVIRGHMSVVGPRPHVKDLNDQYDQTISNYNDRILIKPGITGLSQITGHRGETSGEGAMSNRIKIDLLYVKNWTLSLDLLIIYKTIVDGLFGKSKNAY